MLPSPDFPSPALQDILPKDCRRTYQKLNSPTKDTKRLSPAREIRTYKADKTHCKMAEKLLEGKCSRNPWDQHRERDSPGHTVRVGMANLHSPRK